MAENSTAGTSDDHINRCFHKRVGAHCNGISAEGNDKKRTGTPHKCFRTNG